MAAVKGLTLKDLQKSLSETGLETTGKAKESLKSALAEMVEPAVAGTPDKKVRKEAGGSEYSASVASDIRQIKQGQSKLLEESRKTNSFLSALTKESLNYFESNNELINRLMMSQELASEKKTPLESMGKTSIEKPSKDKDGKQSDIDFGAIGPLLAAMIALAPEIRALPAHIKSFGEIGAVLVGKMANKIETGFGSLLNSIGEKLGIKAPKVPETPGITAAEDLAEQNRMKAKGKAAEVEPPKATSAITEAEDLAEKKRFANKSEQAKAQNRGARGFEKGFKDGSEAKGRAKTKTVKPDVPAESAKPPKLTGSAAGEALGDVAGKTAIETEEKIAAKLGKFLAKSTTKAVAKTIPLTGAGIAAIDSIYDFFGGDIHGGIANAIVAGGSLMSATGIGAPVGEFVAITAAIENLVHEAYREIFTDVDPVTGKETPADYAYDAFTDPKKAAERMAILVPRVTQAVWDEVKRIGSTVQEQMPTVNYGAGAQGGFSKGGRTSRTNTRTPSSTQTSSAGMAQARAAERNLGSTAPVVTNDRTGVLSSSPQTSGGSTTIIRQGDTVNNVNNSSGGGGGSGVNGSPSREVLPSDIELYGSPYSYGFGF